MKEPKAIIDFGLWASYEFPLDSDNNVYFEDINIYFDEYDVKEFLKSFPDELLKNKLERRDLENDLRDNKI